MELILQIIFIGIVATIAIDIWAKLLNLCFNIHTTDWGMVGRWLAHLPKGQVTHNPISSSNKIEHELALGWVFHYFIGITYAALYLLIVSPIYESNPTLLSASLFGLFTVVAPWFVLQPGLGLGVCASHTPNPSMTRSLNLVVHAIFGVALFLGWAVSSQLM